MRKLPALITLMTIVLTACSPSSSGSLQGLWSLVSYGNPANQTSAVPDVDAFIEFKDGQLGGNVGCNGFGGDYTIEGDNIVFGQMMATLMFCEGPVGDQESVTLSVLHDAAPYTLDGDLLTITSADGSAILVLEKR